MRPTMTFVFAVSLASSLALVHAQEPATRVSRTDGSAGQKVRVPLESKAVKGAPYSAETASDSTQTLSDGNRIVRHSTGRVYRDGQGRVRHEEDRGSGNPFVSIIDPEAGVSYSLDPQNHIAWQTSGPAAAEIMAKLGVAKLAVAAQTGADAERRVADARRSEDEARRRLDETQSRQEDQRKREAELMAVTLAGGLVEKGGATIEKVIKDQRREETLDPRVIEGVQANGHRVTTTVPAGAIGNDQPITIVSEEWVSPDLNVLVLTQHSDPRSGESTYRLVNILRVEPDPSLFQVPSDYTIRETGIRKVELARPY
jgi:hypothetical protein